MGWHYYRGKGGKVYLDITGETARDHYSFSARRHAHTSKGPAIRIYWCWEYFDKGDYFFVPDTPEATTADVFSYSDHAANEGRQALAAAGIDEIMLPYFLDAVKRAGVIW